MIIILLMIICVLRIGNIVYADAQNVNNNITNVDLYNSINQIQGTLNNTDNINIIFGNYPFTPSIASSNPIIHLYPFSTNSDLNQFLPSLCIL